MKQIVIPEKRFNVYSFEELSDEAKDDLQMILEETEQEKNRYTEEQAEILLTNLIYREILRNMEA